MIVYGMDYFYLSWKFLLDVVIVNVLNIDTFGTVLKIHFVSISLEKQLRNRIQMLERQIRKKKIK